MLTYGDKSYVWNSGRHLESITDGDNTYSYTYDENGIRTSKTVNGVTTYYNTSDGVILSQTDGTDTMYFQYDTNGAPLGFVYNNVQYFYITNQMGDVVGITDANGNKIAEYTYDDWGKLLSVTGNEIANVNPIRYRGYYYDNETGYYYLQSRYYDANICRFINADVPAIAKVSKDISNGVNIFAYCNNNPTNDSDPTGYWAEKYKGFKWTSKGFNLNVNFAFVNKSFCRIYAMDILRLKKAWFSYKGMTVLRMAAELYFHAIVYYASNALTKIGVKSSTIKSWKKSASYMEINYDDKRVVYFYALWGLSNSVIGLFL